MRMGWTMFIWGGGAAGATLLLFMLGWVLSVRRHRALTGGDWLNGLGYGLLPAFSVGKAFEQYTSLGQGSEVFAPIPADSWFTPGGMFAPCRIELVMGLLCFGGMTIWLIARRRDVSPGIRLIGTSMTLWAAFRMVTEGFHGDEQALLMGQRVGRYALCAVLLAWMIIWSVKQGRSNQERQGMAQPQKGSHGAGAWLSWGIFLLGMICFWLVTLGVLTVGSDVGDLLVICGCTALMGVASLSCACD